MLYKSELGDNELWRSAQHILKKHTKHPNTHTQTHIFMGISEPPPHSPYILHMHMQPLQHSQHRFMREVLHGCLGDREQRIDLGGAVIKRSCSLIRILIILRHGYANDYNTTKHSSSHQYFINWKSLMRPQRWQDVQRKAGMFCYV